MAKGAAAGTAAAQRCRAIRCYPLRKRGEGGPERSEGPGEGQRRLKAPCAVPIDEKSAASATDVEPFHIEQIGNALARKNACRIIESKVLSLAAWSIEKAYPRCDPR